MNTAGKLRDAVAPATLIGLVRNTVPYWFAADHPQSNTTRVCESAGGEMGWLSVLRSAEILTSPKSDADWLDYFTLCLACHHATVASYVPTDVDSKIRLHFWQRSNDRDHLRQLLTIVELARGWSVATVSRRVVMSGSGPVSGHDGEYLSVLIGALGAFTVLGDDTASRIAELVDGELARQAAAFERCRRTRGEQIELLRLSAILTHNAGDIDQGFAGWSDATAGAEFRRRFARLAHENITAYGGTFQRAALLYKRVMAAEGHRNYPLREVAALRRSADLLLPISPFLDAWGETVATHEAMNDDERMATLAALIAGCRKTPNQVGYYRAITGFIAARGGSLDQLKRDLPSAQRRALDDADMRRQLAVSEASFTASMRKKADAALSST
jgi:hypothetical protein